MTFARTHPLYVFLVLALACAAYLMAPTASYSQGQSGVLAGYGWSETIGWISFDCGSPGTCTEISYGIAIDDDGELSGYAWSDHIGWISAQPSDLVGCPSAPCRAYFENGQLQGWMRALSADDLQSGGWDGFISLSDVAPNDSVSYGVTVLNSILSGYAWDGLITGWIDMSFASTNYSACSTPPGYRCVGTISQYTDPQCRTTETDCSTMGPGYTCSGSGECRSPDPVAGTLVARPSIVRKGSPANLVWDARNTSACTVTNGVQTFAGAATGNIFTAPLESATTFELLCADANGDYIPLATARITIIASWNEL